MKKFSVFILASVLLFTFSACRTTNDTSSYSDTSMPTKTITEASSADTSAELTTSVADEASSANEANEALESTATNDCTTLGHKFTENRIESTCTAQGYIKRVCNRCGETDTENFPLTEHSYTKTYQSVSETQHNAVFTCSVCKHSYTEISTHSWSDWTVTSEATQSTAGEKTRVCTVCNHKQTQTISQLPSSTNDRNTRVLELVNIERQKAGLKPLEYYYAGQSAADTRAAEIVTSFSHTRPDGSSCFTVFDEFNINYRAVGENIAYGYQTPEAVVEGWMNSDGHRANILNENFTHLIVGYNNNYWVQLFVGI